MKAVFTYYLDGNQVYPAGDWKIIHEVHQGQLFKRRIFSGELIFGNKSFNKGLSDDYDWIRYVYDDCSRIYLEIYCNEHLQHSIIPYWEGYFNYEIDFEFDEDNCIIKGIPHVLDKYDCIVNMGGFEDTYFGYPILNGATDLVAYDENVPANEIFTTNDGETLENFIRYMILIIADCVDFPVANIVSTYFWNDDWPDGTAYSPNNYVTGAANKLNEIYVLHTDQVMVEIAGGALDGGLYDYDITFKKLTDWFRDTLQVYYYIDEDFKLRFEHISYFRPGFAFEANTDINNEEFDLTIVNYKTNKAYDYRKNKYKYLKEIRVSEEQFEMVNADGQDFIGLPITYDEDCTFDFPEKRTKKYVPNFSTDLPWMITQAATPDEVNRTGYNLFHCKSEFVKNWEDQLITGWTNAAPANDYDVFNAPGDDIFQATEAAANSVWAFSNNLIKPGYVGAGSGFLTGDVMEFHAEITDLSGKPNPPTIRIWNATTAVFIDGGGGACVYLPATNNFVLTIVGAGAIATDTIQIWVTNPIGNCDWDSNAIGILCNFPVNKVVIQYDVGFLSAGSILNAHLSWANLHEDYWEHERVLLEGNMNGVDRVIGVNPFLSKQYDKIQPMIPYVDCCKIVESLNYWTTDMGIGIGYKITEEKNQIIVELLYE